MERIRTIDAGLDLGFLNNELSVGFDWYQRENTDMLAPSQVLPQVLGTDAPMANAGTFAHARMGTNPRLAPSFRRV